MSEAITVAVHQPNFLPWLGYLDKMDRADVFVLLDRVQLIRRAATTRTRVLQGDKPVTLSLAVRHTGTQELPIEEALLAEPERSGKKLAATLRHVYGRKPHWEQFGEPVATLLESPPERLVELNVAVLRLWAHQLGISWEKVRKQSELPHEGTKSTLMASLTVAAGGETYLSGGFDPALAPPELTRGTAADYNDPQLYSAMGVTLLYQGFVHPSYDQGVREFHPGLSALDALVRLGPSTLGLIREANGRPPTAELEQGGA